MPKYMYPGLLSAHSQQSEMDRAVAEAQAKYPRLRELPLALTQGVGRGFSETYEPGDDENPSPGNWNVQLRSPEAIRNRQNWPDDVAFEAIHGLQATDPVYQTYTGAFDASMTDRQKADTQRAYARDQRDFGVTEPYDTFVPHVQAQEYIRGGMFPQQIPNWIGPTGEGRYTPQQMQIFAHIMNYLKGR